MATSRFVLYCSALVLVCGSVITARQTPSKSVNDGVYSADQAARGEQVFKAKCGSCHYPTQFTGEDLFKGWAGKPLSELFDMIRESMPEDNPGTLPVQEYGDVITFFLQLNKYPTGSDELAPTEDAMRGVMLERPKNDR